MTHPLENIAKAIWSAQWEEPFPSPGGIEHALAIQMAEAAAREMAKDDGYGTEYVLAQINNGLRAALEPFAEVGQWLFARDEPDDHPAVRFEGINGYNITLTRRQFKEAHSAFHSSLSCDTGDGE